MDTDKCNNQRRYKTNESIENELKINGKMNMAPSIICPIIQAHHLHTFSSFGLFLGSNLGGQIIEGDQADDHHEVWEISAQS